MPRTKLEVRDVIKQLEEFSQEDFSLLELKVSEEAERREKILSQQVRSMEDMLKKAMQGEENFIFYSTRPLQSTVSSDAVDEILNTISQNRIVEFQGYKWEIECCTPYKNGNNRVIIFILEQFKKELA